MRTGKTLSELAAEIERQSSTRKDYVAPTSQLHMNVQERTGKPTVLEIGDKDVVGINDLAHRQLGANEGEKSSILKHLIEGGDLTRFGLFNAVMRTAENLESYDRATDFERMGGQVIELAANDWKRIAEAA